MEVEHMITEELKLGYEQDEKLDNSIGLQVPKVEPFP